MQAQGEPANFAGPSLHSALSMIGTENMEEQRVIHSITEKGERPWRWLWLNTGKPLGQ